MPLYTVIIFLSSLVQFVGMACRVTPVAPCPRVEAMHVSSLRQGHNSHSSRQPKPIEDIGLIDSSSTPVRSMDTSRFFHCVQL